MENEILKACEIVHPNAANLSPHEFTQLRRQGLGASDTSVYLGLQAQWSTAEDIIQSKLRSELSEDEIAIGKKIQIRMGHYLEPLILDLYSEETNQQVIKPAAMYSLKDYNYLTINYDGITRKNNEPVYPVEAKYVTFYGDKYWNFKKEISEADAWSFTRSSIFDHCEAAAAEFGIPIYYYAQIQQELMGLPEASYGEFAVLRGKYSSFHRFRIPVDLWLRTQITVEGYKIYEKIQRRKLQS